MSYTLVTGGSRGLGFECAKALRALGRAVLLVAKDESRLKAAAAALDCEYRSVDLEDLGAARATFTEILERFGPPETLILAHGVMSEKFAKTLRTTNEEWRRVMAINLDAVFCAVNILGKPMADARNGRVIIFSACLGRMSGPGTAGGLAPYRVSKAGSTRSFATLPTKRRMVRAASSLTRSVRTTRARTWGDRMRRSLPLRAHQRRSGSRPVLLTRAAATIK